MEVNIEKKSISKVAQFLGMGFYSVKANGKFIEADSNARKIFGIPQEETDLSKYSIGDLYIFPAERKLRLDKLNASKGSPIRSTLPLRVNGKNKLLFDQCWWCDSSDNDEKCFAGLIADIEDRVIFPKMFDEFPMGVYQLDDDDKFVHVNKKTLDILGFREEKDLIGKSIGEFYVNLEDLKDFSDQVRKDGHAHEVLKFKNVHKKIIDLEFFAENINQFKKARWGMLRDVTTRERYFKALDKMPTGYYYIEYHKKAKYKHHGRIVQCNAQFAKILGVDNKDDLIGKDVTIFYASKEEGEEYFKLLDEADKKNEPVLGYHFRLKRADNQEIVHIEVDSHLIKENGKVIGREGTIRDISEKVELEEKVKNTEKRLNGITADINNLMHTFLHPVLKFSGHSGLLYQLGKILFKSIRHKTHGKTNIRELGKELENELTKVQRELVNISDISESAAVLAPKFEKIINIFDYNLDKAEENKILVDKANRDTALWILEDLELAEFFNDSIKKGKLMDVITDEFIEYLQNILFDYLIRTANILQNETLVMRREVEALRRYIGLREKREYEFRRLNLGKILVENIEIFEPILAQKDIEIEHQLTGDLVANISEIDIDRVICNLLHNASKYSHEGPGRTVRIKAKELHPENALEFSIESYGIPIKKEELESGKIFEFGFRSNLAYKTDRDGTGVGLADAKEVIEAHNGEITITSKPVRNDGDLPKYKVPYITTVTVRLPKTQKKGEENENQ